MTRSTLLTIEDLIDELDMGKATLKFILHRFSPWLVTQIVDDETYYTEQAVTTLLKIKKLLDTGILPEQIEDSLTQEAEMLKDTAKHPAGNQGTIPMDIASASMFKDMFAVYIEKQDRIDLAQEALARVEARKADAMEKPAAAEEKKAAAMTNIA
ncbi:MAG: MerR family transcriptional regulator, partial [Desulfobacter sp.]|nr:MerR family transcriptional regulator [Desulfobacter sp.]